MDLSELSVKRPVLAIVMSLVILLFGIISYTFLGVREYPSIDPPIINVRTSYPGANADIIESQITEPLEKVINGIQGIRSISSTSSQGTSNITVEFNLNSDLEAAANDVRDKVSQAVRTLPRDIDGLPVVTKSDANADAIISLTVQSNTRNTLDLSDYAENVIGQQLITIPGVSTLQIWGQRKYAMRLRIYPDKLVAYKLTVQDIQNALNRENVELPAGKIAGDNTELVVRTTGQLHSEDDFNNMIIVNNGDQLIRFKDVGLAELGPENEETILRESGIPMVGIALVPQPGSNYIEIADEFYKRLDKIKVDLPSDIKIGIALDNTSFVKKSITEVEETLFIAITLVVIIIYLFFRDWLVAIRPLIDIPVSLVGAMFIMYIAGFSINVLTLLAIVLATGLVVDDGIVVTENIYKKIEAGLSPNRAAIEGTKEIFFAVVSTSVTLAAVFLPVVFMEGFVGRLFREFGVVIAGAVLISAFVSLTLTPMLNARLVRKDKKHSKFYEKTEPFFQWMNSAYENSLKWFMEARWRAWTILGSAIVLIFVLGRSLQSELSPLEDRNWLRLLITAPEGASYEYTDNFIVKISDVIEDSIPEKKGLLTVTAPGFTGAGAVNSGFARIVLSTPDKRERSQQEIADQLSGITRKMTDARVFVLQEQSLSAGGSRSALPVQFVLQNQEFDKLREVVPSFLDRANKSPVFQGVDVNLKFNKPELNVSIDRAKANALGVSVDDIAQTLQLAFSGQRFGYFIMQGKQYQVIGQVDRENRDVPYDLSKLYVKTNSGDLVQLDNLIDIKEISSPPQLYHFNRYQSATISAGLAPGYTIGDGINEMKHIGDSLLDESFSTDLTGPSRDFAESSSNVWFAFVLAIILIYLVLAAQFESFVDPFIIMITVPLAICGALISLWYFNQTLNIFSQIGIIMLIGLVTKNGILIVEFINQLREKGVERGEAIILGSVSRFRPILMTSLATSLGALPIALALGAGAKSRMSMGIVIVGGVLFALIFTLYIIPAMYSVFSRKKEKESYD